MVNIEYFMTWLNEEIQRIENGMGHNNMLNGQHSEAIRIRQKLCEMNAQHVGVDEYADELGVMCDKYCRYPQAYYTGHQDDEERLHEEKCSTCPLTRFLEGEG